MTVLVSVCRLHKCEHGVQCVSGLKSWGFSTLLASYTSKMTQVENYNSSKPSTCCSPKPFLNHAWLNIVGF